MRDFIYLYETADGKCGICEKKTDLVSHSQLKGKYNDVVCVNYDHKTGKIRGLLCGSCSRAHKVAEVEPVHYIDLCNNNKRKPCKKIKKEPLTKKQKTSNSFFEFNETQVYKAIATLRKGNDAQDNCTHLAKDLIDFFQTGIMPTQPSKTDPSSMEDFSMTVIIEPIKREKGSNYEIITHSVVNRSDVTMPYIP